MVYEECGEPDQPEHPVCLLEPHDRFLTACTTGDDWQMTECLASLSLEVNSPGVDSLTGLMLAARGGHTDLVIKLLEREDCDINICDKVGRRINIINTSHLLHCQDGDTALSHACCCGHQDIVTALLSSPLVNINTTDTDLVTPLHKAIANNHVEIVKVLLNQPVLEVSVGWLLLTRPEPHLPLLSGQCTEQIRVHSADTGGRDG